LEVVSGTWLMQTNIFIAINYNDFSERKSIKYISNNYMHAYYFF